eukprot:sb/3470655/
MPSRVVVTKECEATNSLLKEIEEFAESKLSRQAFDRNGFLENRERGSSFDMVQFYDRTNCSPFKKGDIVQKWDQANRIILCMAPPSKIFALFDPASPRPKTTKFQVLVLKKHHFPQKIKLPDRLIKKFLVTTYSHEKDHCVCYSLSGTIMMLLWIIVGNEITPPVTTRAPRWARARRGNNIACTAGKKFLCPNYKKVLIF